MNNNLTLKSVFASSKEQFVSNLQGLSLPKDATKVQKVLTDHLSTLFENENGYRQNLTEAEDYILQSVLQLLNSQQNIAMEIAKSAKSTVAQPQQEIKKANTPNPYATVAGAGVGAVAGGLISTWGAVAGAIAGTALVLYFSAKPISRQSTTSTGEQPKLEAPIIDVNVFTNIVESICESIDGVIDTYRIQVKRVANVYEQREAPSLTNEYSALLAQVANVYKVTEANKEVLPAKVINAVEMLVESLENYNLKIENGKVVAAN